jgi:hypothetical protein
LPDAPGFASWLSHQGLEGTAPARGQRGNSQRPQQLVAGMTARVEQRIDLGNGHALRPAGDRDDGVAGAHIAFLDHAQVEARAPARSQQCRHLRLVRPDADAIAGHPGLAHFEQSRADPVAVADADFVVRQPLDGEVLAELAVREIAAAQALLPVAVRLGLVDEHGALLAAVAAEIALPVTVDVEPPHAPAVLHGLLPDAGVHGPSAPFDVAGKSDAEGEQPGHGRR